MYSRRANYQTVGHLYDLNCKEYLLSIFGCVCGGWGGEWNFDASNVNVVLLGGICICLRHQRECTHALLTVCGSCTDTPVCSTYTREGQ